MRFCAASCGGEIHPRMLAPHIEPEKTAVKKKPAPKGAGLQESG
jgi:hypothetical protein